MDVGFINGTLIASISVPIYLKKINYSRTSRYGHLYITDSFQCPDKILIFSLKKKPSIIRVLFYKDNGH